MNAPLRYIVSIETISAETKGGAMKAAVVKQWGPTPVYTDHPEPDASDGAVVAAVEASALSNLSRGIASGKHYSSKGIQLPMIPGVDGVVRFDDGRRAYAGPLSPHGMMAERTLLDPHEAVEVPEGVDSVTAATGVTGSIAVQLAKSVFGAGRVVVAGRDTTRLQWLQDVAGADDAIALGSEDLGARVAALHAERPFDA